VINDVFNNREIAIGIWIILFVMWSLTRKGLGKTYLGLIKTIFGFFLLTPTVLSLLYMTLAVYALYRLGVWDISLLKMTLLWGIAALALLFQKVRSLADEKGALLSAIRDNFRLIVVVEFIAHFYSFSLLAEMIIVPFATLVGMLQAYNDNTERNHHLAAVFNFILNVFGSYLLYNAFANIWSDAGGFFNIKTLSEFSIPIALSLMFLPLIYVLSVYLKYEALLTRFHVYLIGYDAAYAQVAIHYLRWKAFLSFKGDTKALEILHRNMTQDIAGTIKGISDEVIALKRLIKADKKPGSVPEEEGWYPPKARRFLETLGFETDYYGPTMGNAHWFCYSDSVRIGDPPSYKNTMSYHVSGIEGVVKQLKLTLYVRDVNDQDTAKLAFSNAAMELFDAAMQLDPSPKVSKGLNELKPFSVLAKGKTIELKLEDLSIGEFSDYAWHFSISTSNLELMQS